MTARALPDILIVNKELSAMEKAIETLLLMDDAAKQALGSAARRRFLEIEGAFKERLAAALTPY